MPEDEGAIAVVLEHPGGATEPCDIPPGGQVTYFRLPYTVTDEDVAANLVSVRFQARARTIARPHLHFSERVTQNARGLEFAGHVIFAQR